MEQICESFVWDENPYCLSIYDCLVKDVTALLQNFEPIIDSYDRWTPEREAAKAHYRRARLELVRNATWTIYERVHSLGWNGDPEEIFLQIEDYLCSERPHNLT